MMQPSHPDANNVAAPGVAAAGIEQARQPDMPSYRFNGYLMRPAIESDLPAAENWTAADPDHRGRVKPGFWLIQSKTTNSFVLEDAYGMVLFARLDVASDNMVGGTGYKPLSIEVHIQFSPDQSPSGRLRTMNGLSRGCQWVEKRLRAVGAETIYFNSTDQKLIHFCQRRLGFVWDGRRLEKALGEVKDG